LTRATSAACGLRGVGAPPPRAARGEIVRLTGKREGALLAVDPRFAAEDAERVLDELWEGEELGRDLDPRCDPVDDLAPDRFRVTGGLEPVLEAGDPVGRGMPMTTTRH